MVVASGSNWEVNCKYPEQSIPGTFDPLTNSYPDILSRAAVMFNKVLAIFDSRLNKKLMFSMDERVILAQRATMYLANVEVVSFSDLIANFARNR